MSYVYVDTFSTSLEYILPLHASISARRTTLSVHKRICESEKYLFKDHIIVKIYKDTFGDLGVNIGNGNYPEN